ncbi:MAG: RimK family alpha-L-glutamate ligase [Clostridia bacterium]|nr:RimK family alpha-L-glutamate ligase [Clostridia bacterium]
MNGWLIVNSFMDSDKFKEIYTLLLEAAKAKGISLKLLKSCEITDIVGSSFSGYTLPDFAIFWDKDVMLAQQLENAGLKLFNSADAIYACDNKAQTYISLAKAGIRIPKTIIAPKTFEGIGYNDFDFLKNAIDRLGLPIIIKEAYGSFGQQVFLANTLDEAKEIIKKIGHKEFVFQKFIKNSCGKDVRINVVGGKVVASMLRYNDNDFRSNITNGGNMKPFNPSDAQNQLAVAAAKALNSDFAGVDILFGPDDAPVVCEVNSNPHFKSTLECTGVNLAEHIINYIAEELK